MDPPTFPAYYPAMPAISPAAMRYPYRTTSNAAGGRGMIFYPQPMPVTDSPELSDPAEAPSTSPCSPSENEQKRPQDKKLRRQIANSNERRRMQSINAGFHSLRLLMPHLQGEKMSKAAVLQHAAEHIYRLNQERERLVQQNTSLRMMLSKYWTGDPNHAEVLTEKKVNKATSPLCFDDEKAAAKELEQIFATQKEVDAVKAELERERAKRLSLEMRFKDRSPIEDDDSDASDISDSDDYQHKRPRRITPVSIPRNNLDIIVRAIRQIEGDAFSRSTTPTCGSQERERSSSANGTFRPITSGSMDSSRMSPVTPVCAS